VAAGRTDVFWNWRVLGRAERGTTYVEFGGMRWRSQFKPCASGRNVAGSIPDGVIETFPAELWPWDSTQLLIEMSTRNISWEPKAAGAYG